MESQPPSLEITDLMMDIETTGLRPDRHAILQICFMPFNLEHQVMWPDIAFNMCLRIPPHRDWSMKTWNWWQNHLEVLTRISSRGEDPREVIESLVHYLVQVNPSTKRCWGLRSFDWQFVSGYLEDFGFRMPVPYHKFREVFTAVEALTGHEDFANQIQPKKVEGEAHDALNDCKRQAEWLFRAIKSRG